jgi:hypothetical protein|tara:strand:+ start:2090 stop:2263 length:174 start_codon:yes stop_codon:yes gene_type:complete
MYKSEKTTYVVREIPVELWKQVKSKFVFNKSGYKNIGQVIVNLLGKWVTEVDKDDNK